MISSVLLRVFRCVCSSVNNNKKSTKEKKKLGLFLSLFLFLFSLSPSKNRRKETRPPPRPSLPPRTRGMAKTLEELTYQAPIVHGFDLERLTGRGAARCRRRGRGRGGAAARARRRRRPTPREGARGSLPQAPPPRRSSSGAPQYPASSLYRPAPVGWKGVESLALTFRVERKVPMSPGSRRPTAATGGGGTKGQRKKKKHTWQLQAAPSLPLSLSISRRPFTIMHDIYRKK